MANANAFLETGALEEAAANFAEVLKFDPGDAEARIGLAEVNLAAGRKVQALAAFESLSQVPGVKYRAAQGRGLALLSLGKNKEAQGYFEEAVAGDPQSWRAWNALGQLHDRAGDFGAALDSYQKAASIRPESAEINNNMGVSLMLQQRYAEAGARFRKALQLDPSLDIAETNYRLTLAWEGKYWQAVANLRKQERLSMLNNVGVIAMSRGDLQDAETLLVQALESSPSYFATAAENLERVKELKRQKAERLKQDQSSNTRPGS